MNVYVLKRSKTKYYKEVVTENTTELVEGVSLWTQPVLTSNGTLGGNSFAVSATSSYNSSFAAWKALDGKTDTAWICENDITLPTYYTLDMGKNVNVTQLSFVNRVNNGSYMLSPIGTVEIYGTNGDYTDVSTDWVFLKRYTNTEIESGGEWSIDLSDNKDFYKYYQLRFTELNTKNNQYNRLSLAELNITGYTFDVIKTEDIFYSLRHGDNAYLLCRENKQ